jgi:hypothetical protein
LISFLIGKITLKATLKIKLRWFLLPPVRGGKNQPITENVNLGSVSVGIFRIRRYLNLNITTKSYSIFWEIFVFEEYSIFLFEK